MIMNWKAFNKQHFLIILFLLPAVLLGCTTDQLALLPNPESALEEAAEDTVADLTVCSSSQGVGTWLMAYADETGLFEEYGLRTDIHYMQGGSSAMTALVAGDVDLCHIAGPAIVNAALAIDDPVIVAGLINQQPYSVVVEPEIENVDDLRGKTLAVSSPGGASDTILREGLAHIGLNPETDVTIVAVGKQAERLAAMESGQVAGSLFTPSELGNATSAGFTILLDSKDLDIPNQHTAVVTTRSFLENNQNLVTNYLKAITAARAAMISDPENGPDAIADAFLLDSEQQRNNVRSVYSLVLEDYYDQIPFPTSEGLAKLIEQSRAENPVAREITPDDIIDVSILQELVDNGFIDALYDQE